MRVEIMRNEPEPPYPSPYHPITGRIVNIASVAGRLTIPVLPIYYMSKHSVISFSDAIRRELNKYAIRVSTIEPHGINTPMTSKVNVESLVKRSWSETGDHIKQLYGEDYGNRICRFFETTLKCVVSQVIDPIVDAIISNDPKINYTAGHPLSLIFVNILNYIPTEIVDKLFIYLSDQLLSP
jgi:NAD(P)-dependent dehydrogenase (short-subunit alcohol dehydrogenase family)